VNRGPAKGYIEGLEHRLRETETLLLQILPVVPADHLAAVTAAIAEYEGSPARTGSRSTPPAPPVLNKKTGIEYWEQYPLDSVDSIRRWQQDCAEGGSSHLDTGDSSPEGPTSIDIKSDSNRRYHSSQPLADNPTSGLNMPARNGWRSGRDWPSVYGTNDGDGFVDHPGSEDKASRDWSQTPYVTQHPPNTSQIYQEQMQLDKSEAVMRSSFYQNDFQKQFFW